MRKELISKIVNRIINKVKIDGDEAVVKYTRYFDRLDNFNIKDIKLKIPSISKLKLKDDFTYALELSIKNVRNFHTIEYKHIKKFWITKNYSYFFGQKFTPINSVGIYIPGGKYGYNYISTLLMTIIPAQVAGVKKIIVVTPPRNVSDYFLYTAYRLGIKEIYRVGGIQAIAALAFGTKVIPKVDMIVGPGNVWVTEAKRQLTGTVGIDLLAGPSEVVVVADNNVSMEKVAYELLAQAEHDKYAKSWLISLDSNFAKKVKNYVKNLDKKILSQIEFIVEKDIKKVCDLINSISPEHLTVLASEKQNYIIKNVVNCGAIFYGFNASAVFGDYIAGPSHVLPTATTSRFYSGVSVLTFMKKISLVKFTKKSLGKLSENTALLAEVEGMYWHKKRVLEK
ncbi:MAG: histidinol dehydrogenase [Endomicrobia bacterium]|nr:histidinol dehydrogenase [Endomicrobiia bacterium]